MAAEVDTRGPGGRRRPGVVVSAVAVLAAAAVGFVLWDGAEEPGSAPASPPQGSAVEASSGGAGVADPSSAAVEVADERGSPAGGRAAVDPGGEESADPDAAPDGFGRDRLDAVLSSFYGSSSPDVEGLRELVASLAEGAAIDRASLVRDEDTGVWSGRIDLPAIDAVGAVQFDDDRLSIAVEESNPGRDYFGRELTIEVDLDRGSIERTRANVQHRVDYRRRDVLEQLETRPTPSGWLYTVSRRDGTWLSPILSGAQREPSGALALVVGSAALGPFEGDDLPQVSVDEWSVDFGAWNGWASLHDSALESQD